jgi:hypothetical protein
MTASGGPKGGYDMLGKAKCKILKEIRQTIADENDIPYVTKECTYQGDCSGTCPRCERELRFLEDELAKRKRLGKQIVVTALCSGVVLGTAACADKTAPVDDLAGAVEVEEVLSGEAEEWPEEEDWQEEPSDEQIDK